MDYPAFIIICLSAVLIFFLVKKTTTYVGDALKENKAEDMVNERTLFFIRDELKNYRVYVYSIDKINSEQNEPEKSMTVDIRKAAMADPQSALRKLYSRFMRRNKEDFHVIDCDIYLKGSQIKNHDPF